MIKVLLVDDSPIALAVLKRMLAKAPEIEVVGTAANGREGLSLIPLVNPDVVCTDLHMPLMDGLEFTRETMARHPLPILLVSVSGNSDSLNAFQVMEAGAVDLFQKPRSHFELDFERLAPELITKIKILAGVKVFRRRFGGAGKGHPDPKIDRPAVPLRLVAIGASTGGPQALQTILAGLPEGFPLPIVCLQHISEGFLSGLMDWLASHCRLRIEIAGDEGVPQPGTVYFPRENTHLKFNNCGRFLVSEAPPFEGHRPSITVALNSLAQCFGNSGVGILLTGMGRDGADGLQAVRRAGGITIAQDEATCIVFGMPQQAIALDAAEYVLPLAAIGPMLVQFASPLWGKKESP